MTCGLNEVEHFRHINVSWLKDDFAVLRSKLKLTESTCRSPTCLTDTKASRRAVLWRRLTKGAQTEALRTIQSPLRNLIILLVFLTDGPVKIV